MRRRPAKALESRPVRRRRYLLYRKPAFLPTPGPRRGPGMPSRNAIDLPVFLPGALRLGGRDYAQTTLAVAPSRRGTVMPASLKPC